jgi:hypothetical protein
MLKEQYGSIDKIKESFYENPFSTILDAASVVALAS